MPQENPPPPAPSPVIRVGRMDVRIYDTRDEMGRAAAEDIVVDIRRRLAGQERVRIILAAAPSQSEVLETLVSAADLDWSRVELFHMDEFIGLPPDAPQRFARWLDLRVFSRVAARSWPILPEPDPEAAARAYAAKLAGAPIDIVCLGIGVNGHIAFNDPPVADFDDPLDVKVVALDETCRRQQIDDQGFASLSAVPTHALTLTIPRLLRADRLFCVVPGAHKAAAVAAAVRGPQVTGCPASILRDHPGCTLYLDRAAASGL